MTRMLVCMTTLLLLLGCFGNLAAEEDAYVVQKGDNLWNLAGAHLDDVKLWEQIYRDNPFLQEPGRRFQDNGIVYVMVRPGEKLVGLERLGIMSTLTPIERLVLAKPDPVVIHESLPMWAWWPLIVAVLLLITAWLIYRMLTRDPVNSRPAMVSGGVTEVNATVAMQQVAARAHGLSAPASRVPDYYQLFTVIHQTAGRIWGNMTVRYADGRSVPRRLNGDRAYQAEVRFPDDGHTETLYMLQGCGNELRYGGISRYLPGPEFRFEADPVVQPAAPAPEHAAQPEPAPVAQTAPAPEPAPVAAISEAPAPVINQSGEFVRTKDTPATPQPAGVITFEFKRSNNGQPNMVRLQGIEAEEFTFSVGPDGTTLRYREVEEEEPVGASK